MITYYHQLDPFLIQLSGNFGIRWYSLAYISAAVFAYFVGIYLIRKGRVQIPTEKLMDVVVFIAMGAVIGGRFGYCLFYSPELFLSFDSSFPFWGLLKIHQGGMSSHGGIIGLILFSFLYAYRHKVSFFSILDLSSITGAFGIFLGRIANFINGELFGRVLEGKTWLAVRFPAEIHLWAEQSSLYKKQLLSLKKILPSLDSIMPASVRIPSTWTWEEWVAKSADGDTLYGGYVSYVCNLIVQNSDKDSIKNLLEPLLSLRYPSQLYQSFFGGLLTLLIICVVWLKPRKAGLIGLLWASSYLFFRVFTEFYRQPDSHIGFQLFNLTRGQWLSFFLYFIVMAYGYLFYIQKPKGFRL